MARPGRLVNCSLVFLLVIRCTRAPGQIDGRARARPEPLSHDSSAPGIITASRHRPSYVPYRSPDTGYLQRRAARARVRERDDLYESRSTAYHPGALLRSTPTFSRNHAVRNRASHTANSRRTLYRTTTRLRNRSRAISPRALYCKY